MQDYTKNKFVDIWKFIHFSELWEKCDTSKLDEISPSWFRRKDELEKTSSEYAAFMERLKRQHAIETGIIERMYDISKGVTETLIEKGFAETLLSHGDYNDTITKDQLLSHLKDHLAAVDFVFDYVKNNRELTLSFIRELHQVVTAHQDFAEGRDPFGHKHKIPLLKGKFKERENNPSRQNGEVKIIYKYCPPEYVDAEMDNLYQIYNELLQRNIHPIIIAAWFHHAFSIIHPFQDGNGRVARLLASLILIKFGFFPITVLREDAKYSYLRSLELADEGKTQPLVDYFVALQRKNIEKALTLKSVSTAASFEQAADILASKIKNQNVKKENERGIRMETNRLKIFEMSNDILHDFLGKLQKKMKGSVPIYLTSCKPNAVSKQHYFTPQIVTLASHYGYYYNRFLPKGWFRFVFEISEQKMYQLIITEHHFGYQDDAYVIGALLEFIESKDDTKSIWHFHDDNFRKSSADMIITNVPLDRKPYTLSLDAENIQDRKQNIKTYLDEVVTLTLAQIASEIS